MSFLRRLPPLFLIGLFPVVCLLWLWADSRNHATHWNRIPHAQELYVLTATDSTLHYTHKWATGWEDDAARRVRPWGSSGPFGHVFRTPALAAIFHGHSAMFPAPAWKLTQEREFGLELSTRQWILPFWLILLAWLPPWLGLAWWQARRRRRNSGEER